jgi:carbamoyltransferase
MTILGIHSGHDASLALYKDRKLVGAIAIERYSRNKKEEYLIVQDIEDFLYSFDTSLDDVDYISMGFYGIQFTPFMRIYSPIDQQYPLMIFGRSAMESHLLNHLDLEGYRGNNKPEYVEGLGLTLPPLLDRYRPPYLSNEHTHMLHYKLNVKIDNYDRVIPGYFIDHHTCHAASTYYTSPFKRSSVFTADASMHLHRSCSSYFVTQNNLMNPLRDPGYTYGNFYDCATEYLGVGPGLTKAGTLMGLSSFGRPNKKSMDNWKEWTKPQWEREGIEENHWNDWLFLQMTGKFPFVTGMRKEVLEKSPGYHHFTRENQEVYTKEESDSKEVMDHAASVQYVAEKSLVKYTQDLYEETETINNGNLCLSGGIFLNCNANYKIKRDTDFSNIHFFPACGDDGISVGAALYTANYIHNQPRYIYSNDEIMYLGPNYDHQPDSDYPRKDLDIKFVASEIEKGKIVCWFQGRSEFGPRALGNRSFLSDPRRKEMKDILNSRVKFREWYRPFAPVVLNEFKDEWFDMDFESPFMLYTVPCKRPQDIPAAVHIDSTSRVQTLRKEDNPKVHQLIREFYSLTGVPVLTNTSLNVKGQPIVETPEDAMKLFEESDVDILVINDVMYLK